MKRTTIFIAAFLLLTCCALFAADHVTEMQSNHLDQLVKAFNTREKLEEPIPLQKIAVQGHGTIQGFVYGIYDDIRRPEAIVQAIEITASGDTAGYRSEALVNPDGFYEIPALPEGDYYVMAWGEGYEMQYFEGAKSLADASPVPVFADEVTQEINFKLYPASTGNSVIMGRITNAKDGHPVMRARVSAVSRSCWCFYGTTTDADGNFVITDVSASPYYVTASADGYMIAYYNNKSNSVDADTVFVAENDTVRNIDMALERGGIIGGTITDNEGYPLPEVFIQAFIMTEDSVRHTDPDGGIDPDKESFDHLIPIAQGMSDKQGNYEISGLPTDDYFVQAYQYNRWSYSELWYNGVSSWEEATPISVEQGENIGGIDFQLDLHVPGGSISGIIQDMNDDPIIGASVYVQSQTESEDGSSGVATVWASVQTDKLGRYKVEGLPEGDYYISAYANSRWQYIYRWWPDAENMNDAETVYVSLDQAVDHIDFQLPLVVGKALVSGTVTSADGEPIPWANITLSSFDAQKSESGELWAYASTDSNGNFEISQLPAGTFMATASVWLDDQFDQKWFKNAASAEEADPIILGETDNRSDINFVLDLHPIFGSLTGTVINPATNAPVTHAYLQLTQSNSQNNGLFAPCYGPVDCFRYWPDYAITDENGQFVFEGLWEGTYFLSAYTNGGSTHYKDAIVIDEATPVEIMGGEKTDITVEVPTRTDGKGVIKGYVFYESSTEPFEIAVVKAQPAITTLQWPESERFYSTLSEKDGSYILEGLPDGDYYVSAFAPYAMEEYYPNAFDPSEATPISIVNGEVVEKTVFYLDMVYYAWRGAPEYDDGNNNNSGAATRIYGHVIDTANNALPGCTVYVYQNSEQPQLSVNTNADGSYEIVGLPVGEYYLKATRIGYLGQFNGNVGEMTETIPVQVPVGNTEVNFVLPLNIPTAAEKDEAIPDKLQLVGNYPNPFNPTTTIQFELPQAQQISLAIYNLNGLLVSTLEQGSFAAGRHNVMWNGQSDIGLPVASGVYLVRLTAGDYVETMKIALMR